MSETALTDRIRAWLEGNPEFGLKLQTGWFGCPHDNRHDVTFMSERPNELIVELDGQPYLVFTKPVTVDVSGDDLVLSGHRRLTFDYRSYGDMRPHCNLYGPPGETNFVSIGLP